MWLLPLLALGLAVAFLGNRDRGPASAPGPLTLLGRCLQTGRQPPPQVILCAIAEAEQLGRADVAHGIVRAFVEPVVLAHKRALAAGARAREQAALEEAEPEVIDDAELVLPAHAPLELAAHAESDVDLDAALELAAQLEREGRELVAVPARPRRESAQAPLALEQPAQAFEAFVEEPPAPPCRIRRELAPQPASPIPGVSGPAWEQLCDRLVREAPTYQSERAVGQYHQRKDRLAAIGIDYRRVLGDAAAQRAALDAELADAHQHVVDGGMLEHLGKPIAVPGRDEPVKVTLSGMLGVIQSAGIEAAENWLSAPKNRKRFPHTMAAFVRCNGVF